MLPIDVAPAVPPGGHEPEHDQQPGNADSGILAGPPAADEGIVWDEEGVDEPGSSASADFPGEEEEARGPRMPREPYQPTEAERRLHEPTHLPFRSWCQYCVDGRLDKLPHTSEVGG